MATPPDTTGTRWIYDFGLYDGQDTEFYLAKGFRVVAIEADPGLAEAAQKKFAREIAAEQLRIVHAAIAPEPGPLKFYVNKFNQEWSSIYEEIGGRDGTDYDTIEVPGITAEEVFQDNPAPYYIKIDLELADRLVVDAVAKLGIRAPLFSVEACSLDYLATLRTLGYDKFKLVNQYLNQYAQAPNPPLEGCYVDRKFTNRSAGPFGEEAPGEWITFEAVTKLYLNLRTIQKEYPHVHRGWYDFHAKLAEG